MYEPNFTHQHPLKTLQDLANHQIPALSRAAAKVFNENLGTFLLKSELGCDELTGDPLRFKILPFLEVPAELRDIYSRSTYLMHRYLNRLSDPSRLFAHFHQGNIARIGGRPLLTKGYIKQRSISLRSGWLPPLFDDLLCVQDEGRIKLGRIEAQSASGYPSFGCDSSVAQASRAIGIAPNAQQMHLGRATMSDALLALVEEFGEVQVIDIDPLTSIMAGDQLYMARQLGDQDSVPLNLRRLGRDPLKGWYIDEEVPLRENLAGQATFKTGRRIFLTNVILRTTEQELHSLAGEVDNDLLYDFLTDYTSINWLQTTQDMHLIDKGTLLDLEKFFEAEGYQEELVVSSELILPEQFLPEGNYFLKPLRGHSGKNSCPIRVVKAADADQWLQRADWIETDNKIFQGAKKVYQLVGSGSTEVSERVKYLVISGGNCKLDAKCDFLAQSRFDPAPISLQVPCEFRNNAALHSSVEFRAGSMIPQRQKAGDAAFSLCIRVVPRDDGKVLTRTNVIVGIRALYAILCREPDFLSASMADRYRLIDQFSTGFGPAYIKG